MDESESISRDATREHFLALDVLRHAKNVFLWLAFVAVAVHLVLYAVARRLESSDPVSRWQPRMEGLLAAAGFVGRASVFVVSGILLISLLICLIARLGGAAALARACVWSLAASALLVPWVRVGFQEMPDVSSAFYGVDELTRRPVDGDATTSFFAFLRFALCPVLVAAALGLSQRWFAAAYRKMTALPAAKLPIREV